MTFYPLIGQLNVAFVGLVTNVLSPGPQTGQSGGTAAHEWVKDYITLKGIQLDQSARQFDREGCRVSDACSRFRWELPNTLGKFKKFISLYC